MPDLDSARYRDDLAGSIRAGLLEGVGGLIEQRPDAQMVTLVDPFETFARIDPNLISPFDEGARRAAMAKVERAHAAQVRSRSVERIELDPTTEAGIDADIDVYASMIDEQIRENEMPLAVLLAEEGIEPGLPLEDMVQASWDES